jgi:uncharacterized protein YndB with AHSA1/START domain
MTTPEHLTHFWGPAGTTTPLDGIVVELRPGGAFETQMVAEQTGDDHVMRAVYEEIDPPRRLVWREVDSGVVTTVTFTDLGDGTTEVTTHQQHLPRALPVARGPVRLVDRPRPPRPLRHVDHLTRPTQAPTRRCRLRLRLWRTRRRGA